MRIARSATMYGNARHLAPIQSINLSRSRFSTSVWRLAEERSSKDASQIKYVDRNIASYHRAITKFSDLPQNFGFNQHMPIDHELKDLLRSIVHKFNAPVTYAFGYGSGVFSQGKSASARGSQKPQIDLIFGVNHAQHWHDLNIKQFPDHYSFLSSFGSGVVTAVQNKMGAGVYFNPFVEINGVIIKYGVVNVDTLLKDLADWDTLYLAGRLHKPVKIIRDEPRVRFANQANLISVLRTALLLLPETFSEADLYKTIAGVSYRGDPRMRFGENPHKVSNIVENQFPNFRRLYSPLMDLLPNLTIASTDPVILTQDMDPIRRGNMVCRLPLSFRNKVYAQYVGSYRPISSSDKESITDEHYLAALNPGSAIGKAGMSQGGFKSVKGTDFDRHIASDPGLISALNHAIHNTVSVPSSVQSIKGILTSGIVKSFDYASEKLKKYYQGKAQVK
ncbi:mitochondrial matrix Mmp37 [Nadsonia fulvescens var. elongata DSM 6958]|uniref:Phosphatidate cytidylyltransferase, mitochondrial n=1 Tax=Nadsonia fulvescens var. elongata DSM 6958 TaxID=857566 RepID=A0A1E3PCS5_9ASCO|nr:mitochondrial matrix Mmp37 [Nadsonia fulvescens var. elongata DSM 6958]